MVGKAKNNDLLDETGIGAVDPSRKRDLLEELGLEQ
jgi:hypothetical protein